MHEQKTENLRGVVGKARAQQRFLLERFYPSKDLKQFIEHYWLISWDLPEGTPHTQQVISHPCVNVSFLQNNSSATGVSTKQFEHTLMGKGNLVGIRFTPAGFYPFATQADVKMTDLTNQIMPVDKFFKIDVPKFETNILALPTTSAKTKSIEQSLFTTPPKADVNIAKINEIIKQVETDKNILKVSDICQKFNLEDRQIQRLFKKYIGINAKWIINRYRIHEALEAVETTNHINWSDLAISLGYFDQGHFIRDFKNTTGTAPSSYFKNLK